MLHYFLLSLQTQQQENYYLKDNSIMSNSLALAFLISTEQMSQYFWKALRVFGVTVRFRIDFC